MYQWNLRVLRFFFSVFRNLGYAQKPISINFYTLFGFGRNKTLEILDEMKSAIFYFFWNHLNTKLSSIPSSIKQLFSFFRATPRHQGLRGIFNS